MHARNIDMYTHILTKSVDFYPCMYFFLFSIMPFIAMPNRNVRITVIFYTTIYIDRKQKSVEKHAPY